MYTTKSRLVFAVAVEDVQEVAKERIGRKLTEDELYAASKGIEAGLECWHEVVCYAVDEAVSESRVKGKA